MNRSLLFVPAKEKMLKKIGTLEADIYIIDLEESIEHENKDEAIQLLIHTLSDIDAYANNIVVRLNRSNYKKEMQLLNEYNVGFMLPKYESVSDYKEIDRYGKKHEIYALIETPMGIVNIKEIVSNSLIKAIAFGAEDFTASVGMKNDIEYLRYQKGCLVTYGKAYNKLVYDTPSFQLYDYEQFKNEVDEARKLGFDGKMAINPKHLSYINRTFADADIKVMQSIIKEYEKQGKAVLVFNGKIYESLHINHMKKILKEYNEV